MVMCLSKGQLHFVHFTDTFSELISWFKLFSYHQATPKSRRELFNFLTHILVEAFVTQRVVHLAHSRPLSDYAPSKLHGNLELKSIAKKLEIKIRKRLAKRARRKKKYCDTHFSCGCMRGRPQFHSECVNEHFWLCDGVKWTEEGRRAVKTSQDEAKQSQKESRTLRVWWPGASNDSPNASASPNPEIEIKLPVPSHLVVPNTQSNIKKRNSPSIYGQLPQR